MRWTTRFHYMSGRGSPSKLRTADVTNCMAKQAIARLKFGMLSHLSDVY